VVLAGTTRQSERESGACLKVTLRRGRGEETSGRVSEEEEQTERRAEPAYANQTAQVQVNGEITDHGSC